MDKEKLLKKFKLKFILGHIAISSIFFIWVYTVTYGIISEKQFFTYGLIAAVISLILGFIENKIFGEKRKREELAVMPMIISIHDTVESLKKQRTVYNILYVLSFGFGFGLRGASVVFILLCSISHLFSSFANLTTKKIKYIENKPEGLNF